MGSVTIININITVNISLEKAWEYWTLPDHITKWNFASEDWHCPKAMNDLRKDGNFDFRMEAKDGVFGFDFNGVYDEIIINERIAYTLGDGRKVIVSFEKNDAGTLITENFEAETENSLELQRAGWQAILDNYKKYSEEQFAKIQTLNDNDENK